MTGKATPGDGTPQATPTHIQTELTQTEHEPPPLAPPPLAPLRDTIEAHGLNARKSLGQHFLLDLNITRKIVRLAGLSARQSVLEIGPGPGGLTRAILETGAMASVIEKDARAIAIMEELRDAYGGSRLAIHEGDALQADEPALLPGPVSILSNLPYNISTELLIKWLRLNHRPADHASPAPYWTIMALMFQREVADRILAGPGSKAYGRLSVIAQAASRPRRGFDLPASAFTPPPKVASTVVLFDPAPRLDHLATLEAVTRAAFGQRRKMLRTSLKPVFGDQLDDALSATGLDATARAETVSVDTFIALADYRARH